MQVLKARSAAAVRLNVLLHHVWVWDGSSVVFIVCRALKSIVHAGGRRLVADMHWEKKRWKGVRAVFSDRSTKWTGYSD